MHGHVQVASCDVVCCQGLVECSSVTVVLCVVGQSDGKVKYRTVWSSEGQVRFGEVMYRKGKVRWRFVR